MSLFSLSVRPLAQMCKWTLRHASHSKLTNLYSQRCLATSVLLTKDVTYTQNMDNRTRQSTETIRTVELMKEIEELVDDDEIRDYFIPLTSRSLVRHLLEEDFFSQEEKKQMERLALALDGIAVNRYQGLVQELKGLFDTLNPDKDTVDTKQVPLRDRLDKEFWLLQKLAIIMEKANFYELPGHIVQAALKEHGTETGVKVKVDTARYAVLRFWTLGKELPTIPLSWNKKITGFLMQLKLPQFLEKYKQKVKRPKPLQFYKRVVVAVRLRTDHKLFLKAFRDIPVHALEQLLPKGKVYMSDFQKTVLTTSLSLSGLGVLAKIVTYLAGFQIQWTVGIAALSALVAARTWLTFTKRKTKYIADMNRILYFKNLSNNPGLLTLLKNRAEEEFFKEVLLAYTFLLVERPPSVKTKPSEKQKPEELGGITQGLLEKQIEAWVLKNLAAKIEFESQEAVEYLESLGLLSRQGDLLHVVPLATALQLIPSPHISFVARALGEDIHEGYDKDLILDNLIREEMKKLRYSWD
ncbi:transmembrane protein 143-like [Tachypleus tridentatus]|uniref:transmembrane protein 143-like n=1 Tax=Tachypleus tridentatus TaxID=6853 RepID=UPI003FD08A14